LIKKLKANEKQTALEHVRRQFEALLINFQKDNSPEVKLRLQDINEVFK
jgi:hypothetical protein